MDFLMALRAFLNKECVWTRNQASSSYSQVYTATTSYSPVFKLPRPHRRHRGKYFAFNVAVIVLRPKLAPFYVTIYINDTLLACVRPDSLCVKKIPGRWGLNLIYFGRFSPVDSSAKIPSNVCHPPGYERIPSLSEILDCANNCTGRSLQDVLGPAAVPVGKCLWTNGIQTLEFMLCDQMMMLCPNIPGVPSLGRIINLLTRCTREDCVACYGHGIHAAVYSGHTDPRSPGTSQTCPCILSCSVAAGNHAVITGNRNLLALIFPAEVHMSVRSLRFRNPPNPTSVCDIFCGVNDDGDEVECNQSAWITLAHSQLASRLQIYGCQVLKRVVIRY